jgi:hypothetical protein
MAKNPTIVDFINRPLRNFIILKTLKRFTCVIVWITSNGSVLCYEKSYPMCIKIFERVLVPWNSCAVLEKIYFPWEHEYIYIFLETAYPMYDYNIFCSLIFFASLVDPHLWIFIVVYLSSWWAHMLDGSMALHARWFYGPTC